MIEPPTYPARPLNGGALDVALPKRGEWRAEPKYNGWRALVHIETGAMFNRENEPLSIQYEFRHALAALKHHLPWWTWADCEALSRRHGLGKGALIVLDLIGNGNSDSAYAARRLALIGSRIRTLMLNDTPNPDGLYIAPSYVSAREAWEEAKAANERLAVEFYEGVVCKRTDAPYPIQKISPTRETADWIKHRWKH